MSGQIKFFRKNRADISFDSVTVVASQNDDVSFLARGRSLQSGWMTTGSVDADNTTFEIDWADPQIIDSIVLVNHNFKSYTIQYDNGSGWTNFSTTINPTTNANDTTFHSFTKLFDVMKIKLTVLGTIVANSEKFLSTFVVTEALGQFNGWPVIAKPTVGRNRGVSKMLSGKSFVRENIGNYNWQLNVAAWRDSADLALVQVLYDQNEGFLCSLTGGVESQFFANQKPYRNKDIVLMKCSDEHNPEWYKGLYTSGQKIGIQLVEVVD